MNSTITKRSNWLFFVGPIAITAIFAALAFFGAAWTRDGDKTSAIWLANAVVVAFLLQKPSREQIWVLFACFAANLIVLLHLGDVPFRAVSIAAVNVIEVRLVLALTARFCGATARLDEFTVLLRFTAVAFVVPAFSGAFATLALFQGNSSMVLPIWGNWAVAHALGFVIATPIVVIAINTYRSAAKLDRQTIISWVTLISSTAAISVLIFSQSSFPLLFLACPLVIFAAFLTGISGTAASVTIVSIIAISATMMGSGPIVLVREGLSWSLLTLQLFLATNFLMGLPVAAVLAERREVLRELAWRDKELTLLAANATDGIFRLSLTGICKYASPSVHNLLGVPAGSLIDGNMLTGFHPDDRAGVEAAFGALRDGVKDHALIAYRHERLGTPGEYIWLEANCGLVRNAANEPSEIIASIRNISRRKAMEEELKDARKRAEAAVEARSAFMANMSHEIRTPMNGVIGFTEVLLAGELTEKQRRQIELIAESGRAMLRLLNDILDMSKIEAGQMTYAPGPVDLHHVLSSVARMMQPIAEAKGLKVDISVADALPEQIITDPLRFRQIILNLLSNAIKFTTYGHVRIAASKQTDINQQFLEITVEDSGIGMAADRLEAIFAPFMQAELDTSQRFGGTGLGLSISQELARLMGGEIAVTSQEGSGTTFTLKLPFEAYDSASTKAPPANEEKLRELLPELRVLVAEDNDINQQLMQDMATALGIQLEIACDGEGAIKAVRQAARARNSFAMVFMDLRMPGMGGLEATRRIRDLGYDADELPIIALTANAYQDDIDACKEAGMQGHLAKPLRLNDFKNEILKHCVLPADQAIKQLPLDQVDAPKAQAKVEDRYQERKRELFDRLATAQNKQSVSPSELEELMDMLHKLAGTAGFFGEDELGQAAGELEQALRSAESGHIQIILEYPDLLSVGAR